MATVRCCSTRCLFRQAKVEGYSRIYHSRHGYQTRIPGTGLPGEAEKLQIVATPKFEAVSRLPNMVKRNTITLTDDGAILLRKAWFEPRVLSSEVKPCAKEHASLWIQRAGQSAKDEGIKYVGGIGLGDSYPLFHHGAGDD
ncbi:conserved hypothetical protein [Histoplasma capsulatum H143]|uniref:Uncharacterized protein n=1 Tax=Ajellomyces capsulatus (strain H143) TaxID=544712 RepID=C6H2I8_AJECH|nr:conserved hypothetical protein [Histoplasma capsulatum H143]